MTSSECREVVEFWIDEVGPKGWYAVDDLVDARIRKRFGQVWEDATLGRLNHWSASADGALALMIVLDQFSRNLFRGEAGAFSADALARQMAKSVIGRKLDLQVSGPERQFFYMPLMHSEYLADQERCVCLVKMRMHDGGMANMPHAAKHRAVIRRFGRFPSRNAALGRKDSDAELAYRAAGGYMG